ncbi:MAG: exodeoxyribonuclease V subunit alpha [Gammaproteobacteria bacterium]|nr:exodeoxyribonuclease V subunit alpha [Gammaproteobacteria bacterium]MBU2058585.1 exodeoxyribonuclease V subunit alpha [Gammaproteobacteria bacterium]MBU2173537.1 exodeoxyribonuclease V subunit alpha [Gammaproteobacteria bacterium]MBU2246491.1 exodeoxyribonuclease V subunit alpha [Gammaproteobacteria bacterium]MBU2344839.1 exodeoxyribonuclease V subunit alpha [Gammaproteobacteria bacterium]
MSDIELVEKQLELKMQGKDWRALDKALVTFFREQQQLEPALALMIGQCSFALSAGHLCLPLRLMPQYSEQEWLDCMALYPDLIQLNENTNQPFVYANNALYMRRYFSYQQQIALYLQQSSERSQQLRQAIDPALLSRLLEPLFPATDVPDWQRLSCAIAASSSFSVITGGPGTGKTTTVVKLLLVLQQLQQQQGAAPLTIQLAAPTGKAAVRLRTSIRTTLDKLPAPAEIKSQVPTDVSTLHKLLGARAQSRQFKQNALEPLALDLLVVDEASMLDVELMAALLSALPVHARLILLGDKDQLASVEAGALMAELCQWAEQGHYLAETATWLNQLSAAAIPAALISATGKALEQQIGMLRVSHRFDPQSGIAKLAHAVNAGLSAEVAAICRADYADLQYLDATDFKQLKNFVLTGQAKSQREDAAGFSFYLNTVRQSPPLEAEDQLIDLWAQQVLADFSAFQLLCAVRQGPLGVEQVNLSVEKMLHQAGLIQQSCHWYAGRPVMVTQNDYALGLMNGDVGICLLRPYQGKPMLAVAFAAEDSSKAVRWVLPSRLQQIETAYAITVHKSQGSEFRHAVLVLPEHFSPVLSRELIYTGITRAAKLFSLICGKADLLALAIEQKVQRYGAVRL